MGDFKSGNRGGFSRGGNRSGGSRFGGRSGGSGGFNRGGDRGRSFGGGQGRPEMHEATCSDCGKKCQVPFRPTGSKPVLCSECFRQSGNGNNSGGNFASRNQDKSHQISSSSGISQEQFKQLNEKLDKILLVLNDLELTTEEDEEEDLEDDSEEDSEE